MADVDSENAVNENDEYNNDNCSESDSIDTLELLKESAEISKLASLNAKSYEDVDDDENGDEDVEENKFERIYEENDVRDIVPLENSDDLNKKSDENDENKEPSENDEKPKKVEFKTNFSYGFDDDEDIKTDDLKHLEPKLRDAWIEMRRLDKVLKRVTEKEKRIKLETRSLIEKNRVELELLKMTSDRKESKLEQENTNNYMALAFFDKAIDDDAKDDDLISNPDDLATPVFKTQLPDLNDAETIVNDKATTRRTTSSVRSSVSTIDIESKRTKGGSTSSKLSRNKSQDLNSNKNDKNFIKRNIQLAQDAGGTLAMTDDEKKRLEDILNEVDFNDNEELKIEFDGKEQVQIANYDPSLIQLAPGSGFLPSRAEEERIKEIDSRLENRNYSRLLTGSRAASNLYTVSPSITNSAASVVESEVYSTLLNFEQKKVKLNDEFDENAFGDKFIREARVSREQESRLKYIESQLERYKTPSSASGDETLNSASGTRSASQVTLIDETTLQNLLDECSMSSRNVISLIHNHKLGTVKEEDNNTENGTNDELELLNDEPNLEMDENIIKQLVEQAKVEGILPSTNRTDDTEEPTVSFYEQALEVLSHRSSSIQQDEENNDGEVLKLPKIENNNNEDNSSRSTSTKIRNLNRQSESANLLSRPASSASRVENDSRASFNESASPIPIGNNSSTTANSFLPKIDSRYLSK